MRMHQSQTLCFSRASSRRAFAFSISLFRDLRVSTSDAWAVHKIISGFMRCQHFRTHLWPSLYLHFVCAGERCHRTTESTLHTRLGSSPGRPVNEREHFGRSLWNLLHQLGVAPTSWSDFFCAALLYGPGWSPLNCFRMQRRHCLSCRTMLSNLHMGINFFYKFGTFCPSNCERGSDPSFQWMGTVTLLVTWQSWHPSWQSSADCHSTQKWRPTKYCLSTATKRSKIQELQWYLKAYQWDLQFILSIIMNAISRLGAKTVTTYA
jgi:hypothetical protein